MTPHPYRLALSCLDTPPAREPPAKRRLPIEALVVACGFIAASTGIATLHAVGHGGHVEIGPAALAHVRKPKPAARRTEPRARPREEESAVVAERPFLRGTHDPKALLNAAKDLQWLHLDVSIDEVQMAKGFAWEDPLGDFWPSRVLPVYGTGHHLDGLELHTIPVKSPLRAAGLAEGDELLGIDGYDFTDDTYKSVDVVEARKRGWAVVEVSRAHHHVVLSIHWPVR